MDAGSYPRIAASAHTLPPGEVIEALHSSPEGLTPEEAARRLEVFGPNELTHSEPPSPWAVLAAQFRNLLIVMLLVGAGLSALVGHGLEAVIIAVIVLFAALLGFVQEYRAERALQALREMASPTAKVIRGATLTTIESRLLVPGDVVVLEAGDRVPADLRLITAVNLRIDESALTGESVPVSKDADILSDQDAGPGDRHGMAFAGTVVVHGRGRGVVTATGMSTEFGRIAGMLDTIEVGRTPLQENLDRLGRWLAAAAAVVVAVIAVVGVLRGLGLLDMFLFGIALAVAVVPEALPAVVTISLALGVRKMVARNVLVRRLPAVETLGSTSVVCTDKTGTLTLNQMTVRTLVTIDGAYQPGRDGPPPDPVKKLLTAAVLASDADPTSGMGDPTEVALVRAGADLGIVKAEVEQRMPRIDERPFSSETKRMVTVHRSPDGRVVAFAKGAPEVILSMCGETDGFVERAAEMADQGLRVLGVAVKEGWDGDEQGMTFLGLVGLLDPPRPEVPDAVREAQEAGIRVVMVTGDHPATAVAVAREVGIHRQGDRVLSGREMNELTDDRLREVVPQVTVYARVSPADKLRIVEAWQSHRQVVAMTGDGVNDAPALKRADIGVAMGITGTDVSKEAAEIVLLDDNFASIVAAVEEGRGIYSNIKKYLMYLLSSNLGEILLIAVATLAGLPLPLTAVQILYVNLATDGLPALALSVDPPEADLMKRPPRDPGRGIFTAPVVTLMTAGGVWSAVVNLAVFLVTWRSTGDQQLAVAHTFGSLVLIQFFKAYTFRSDHLPVWQRPFANRWLNLAVGWELLLLAAIVYLPFLQPLFDTRSFTLGEWAALGAAGFSVVPVLEAVKAAVRRGWLGEVE
ncbi:MAG: ATPase [Acidimicrobiia bacterium]|nr:MAG: ATPase [Acidimicrobiia bacterium]